MWFVSIPLAPFVCFCYEKYSNKFAATLFGVIRFVSTHQNGEYLLLPWYAKLVTNPLLRTDSYPFDPHLMSNGSAVEHPANNTIEKKTLKHVRKQ